jgi:hypothetical protein
LKNIRRVAITLEEEDKNKKDDMYIARYGGIQCVWFTAGMVVVANNNNVISPYDRDGKGGQNGHHD